jgi:hypothetical protein
VYILIKNKSYFILSLILLARSAGEILHASVNAPCINDYCTFYKGNDARIEFTFTLRKIIDNKNNNKTHLSFLIGKKAQTVRAKVMATVGTVDHDFVLPNHDVCKLLGCPLKNGVPYSYHHSLFVSPTYPSVC